MNKPKTKATKRVSRAGRPPADQTESRKVALLNAATDVFLRAGFSGATMVAIAKKAGASMETLYARYPNKLELFAALIQRKTSALHEVMGPLNPERGPHEELTRYGIELVSMIVTPDMQRLHRIVIAGSIDSPELGSMLWEAGPGRGFTILRTYLREQNMRGTLVVDDPDSAARMLMGMLVGEIAIRTTLGLKITVQTRSAQHAWAIYVIEKFLSIFAPPGDQKTGGNIPASLPSSGAISTQCVAD